LDRPRHRREPPHRRDRPEGSGNFSAGDTLADYPKVVCDEWPANEISPEIANVFVVFEGDIVLTSDGDCFCPSTEILMSAEPLVIGGRATHGCGY